MWGISDARVVVEECGAMPDLEDKEGEASVLFFRPRRISHSGQTALHKAALNGHLSVIECLLPDRADVHAQDADGWTALHNACSKVSLLAGRPYNARLRVL